MNSKGKYIDIMETALDAYGADRIVRYFDSVKQSGLTEHGFPRLTANIGILLAFGRKSEWKDIFIEMMDFCCDEVRVKKAGNDFSIRELCSAILILRERKTVPEEKLKLWSDKLRAFEPELKYTCVAKSEEDNLANWAAYCAASEYLRGIVCNINTTEFVDRQIATQLRRFDRNGFYEDPHCPILYDYAARVQLASILFFGYDGKHKCEIEELLDKSGKLSLLMQSVTGEMPYGGRSNQFLFNDAYLAALFEFEARRSMSKGDRVSAEKFKKAASSAADSVFRWSKEGSICHVKNYYDIDSMIGCEGYAYFDKYMITLASFIFLAYLFSDDSVQADKSSYSSNTSYVYRTDCNFHKIFVRFNKYFLEFDTDADFNYDSNGLGRIHKEGLPSALCLSVPFAKSPSYGLDGENLSDMSLCGFIEKDGIIISCAEKGCKYIYCGEEKSESSLSFSFLCNTENASLSEKYTLDDNGIDIELNSKDSCGFFIPVFCFDGKNKTDIAVSGNKIEVCYRNGCCIYTADEPISSDFQYYSNRNGKYKVYKIQAKHIHICLCDATEHYSIREKK